MRSEILDGVLPCLLCDLSNAVASFAIWRVVPFLGQPISGMPPPHSARQRPSDAPSCNRRANLSPLPRDEGGAALFEARIRGESCGG